MIPTSTIHKVMRAGPFVKTLKSRQFVKSLECNPISESIMGLFIYNGMPDMKELEYIKSVGVIFHV